MTLAELLLKLGKIRTVTAEENDALDAAVEGMELGNAAATADPAGHLDVYAELSTRFAEILHSCELVEPALKEAERAVKLARAAVRDHPYGSRYVLSAALDLYARCLAGGDRLDEALAAAEESVALAREGLRENGGLVIVRVARALHALSLVHGKADRTTDAWVAAQEELLLIQRAVQISRGAFGVDAAEVSERLFDIAVSRDDREGTVRWGLQAIKTWNDVVSVGNGALHRRRLAQLLDRYTAAMVDANRIGDAVPSSAAAASVWGELSTVYGARYQDFWAWSLEESARCLRLAGKEEAAVKPALEALELWKDLVSGSASDRVVLAECVRLQREVAWSLFETRRFAAAVDECRQLVEHDRADAGEDLAFSLYLLAGARLGGKSDLPTALDEVRESSTIFHRLAEADPASYRPRAWLAQFREVEVLNALGRRAEAKQLAAEVSAQQPEILELQQRRESAAPR